MSARNHVLPEPTRHLPSETIDPRFAQQVNKHVKTNLIIYWVLGYSINLMQRRLSGKVWISWRRGAFLYAFPMCSSHARFQVLQRIAAFLRFSERTRTTRTNTTVLLWNSRSEFCTTGTEACQRKTIIYWILGFSPTWMPRRFCKKASTSWRWEPFLYAFPMFFVCATAIFWTIS